MEQNQQKKKYVSIGVVMGEMFNLYFRNFMKFAMPILGIFAAIIGVAVAGSYYVVFDVNNIDQWAESLFLDRFDYSNFQNPAFYMNIGLLTLALTFGIAIITILILRIAASTYIDREETMSQAVVFTLSALLPFFLVSLLAGLVTMIGFALLIIPGVMLSYGLSLTGIVYLEERPAIIEALKRSWNLMNGYKMIYFVILLLYSILSSAIESILSAVLDVAIGPLTDFIAASTDGSYPIVMAVAMIPNLVSSLMWPLSIILPVIFYYNVKKEKEGFNVEQMGDDFMSSAFTKKN